MYNRVDAATCRSVCVRRWFSSPTTPTSSSIVWNGPSRGSSSEDPKRATGFLVVLVVADVAKPSPVFVFFTRHSTDSYTACPPSPHLPLPIPDRIVFTTISILTRSSIVIGYLVAIQDRGPASLAFMSVTQIRHRHCNEWKTKQKKKQKRPSHSDHWFAFFQIIHFRPYLRRLFPSIRSRMASRKGTNSCPSLKLDTDHSFSVFHCYWLPSCNPWSWSCCTGIDVRL